ncbi:MAG: CPBP family intramembrane metalloprotease [Candidatus Omnitrophica bacterium]|nr:CPBP family intramembrane metalloprotease [Candidatus Omnitrophota bacterium]
MKAIFVELFYFFKREKVYSFLLALVIFFYGAVFWMHQMDKGERVASRTMQRIEALLKEAPQKPQMIQEQLSQRPLLWWLVQLFTVLFVFAFGLGIWFGLSDLRRLFSRGELIPSLRQGLHISWGVSDIAKVMILFFSSSILLNLVLAVLRPFLINRSHSSLLIVHTLLLDLAAVFLMIWVVTRSGARLWDLMGFHLRRLPWHEVWWGVRTYFVILPIFITILATLVYLASRLSYEPPPHPLVEILLEEERTSLWLLVYSLLAACLIGPVVEEIFFRGFFYPALRKYLGVGWTMALTAVLFAGVHENIFSFLPIFFLGLVLSYLYEKRTNLASCITLHIIHNTAFISYFFLMKSVLLNS